MMSLFIEPPVAGIVQISKRAAPFARRAKATVPSRPHAASVLRSSVDVIRTLAPGFPTSGTGIFQRSSWPPGPFDHMICGFVAEGDHVGATSSFESVVSWRRLDPSRFTTQMSEFFVRVETKAIRLASGDQAG